MRYFVLRCSILLLLFISCATAQQAGQASAAPDLNAIREETVQILAGLIKIDTSNPPGNETKAAQYIKVLLDREGIASEIVESAPGRGSVIARLKGSGKKKPLLLMGHIDVVGVEREKWSVDPFGGVIKDGFIYGRGASDDKGMVAANLAVLLQLHRSKLPLDRDVIYLAEAGEEGTTEYGMDFVVEKHWDKIAAEYAINEGGDFSLENGKLRYAGVSTTEKLPRGLRLVARGSSGHGSMPRLDNPIVHLAAAVAKVGAWQPPMRLNDTTHAFFARLATISPSEEAQLYRNVERPEVQEKLRTTKIRFNSMLRTSISPNIIRGGFRSNVIPAEAEAYLDVRALPDEDIDALIQTLRKLIDDPAVEVLRRPDVRQRPAAAPSSFDNEMFHALERAQQKVFAGSVTLPVMQVGATDSAQLRARGVQAYGISIPKAEEESRRVHGIDERISIDALGKFVDYLWTAVVDVAAAK
jgi:acetylornithine deacetylase/succinyl-diaminopimelate desuccinylase-like protein